MGVRIIAGSLRSRSLQAPSGTATRPTSDRLRETLFNVLAPRIDGADFADLYAGSGAVGIEALSRGAAHVTFVEKAPSALKVLRENLDRLGIKSGFDIQAAPVAAWLRRGEAKSTFDLIFLDPPYDAGEEYASTLGMLGGPAAGWLNPGARIIAEHRRNDKLQENYRALQRTRLLQQGDAALSFFELAESEVKEGKEDK